MNGQTTKAVSVVIPTRNRRKTLLRTLRALNGQRRPRGGFEVVVSDDGSTDGSLDAVKAVRRELEYPLRAITSPGKGQGAARNAAVGACYGHLLLFLGDDTSPADEEIVLRHWQLHDRIPDENYAVLGFIRYEPAPAPGTFEYWLEHGGPQFAYHELSAGVVPIADYFDCSHSSIKRLIFDKVGGFDERFGDYEGAEMGMRMGYLGVRLEYHPELVVLHDHPTTLERSLRRVRRAGRSAALYNKVYKDRPSGHIQPVQGIRWALLRKITPLLKALAWLRLPLAFREEVWRLLHFAAYAEGYGTGPLNMKDPGSEHGV